MFRARPLLPLFAAAALVALAGCGSRGFDDLPVEAKDPLAEEGDPGLPAGCDLTKESEPWGFRADAAGFHRRAPGGEFERWWPIGLNFGLAVPGTSPGEFQATRSQIRRWLEATADLGADLVRAYTIQTPVFYEEIVCWNQLHPDEPLFLLQGSWVNEPDPAVSDTYLDPYEVEFAGDEIDKVVDVVHGNRTIPSGSPDNPMGYGRAFGTYTADVSPWLAGWIFGSELDPYVIDVTLEENAGLFDYKGEHLALAGADAMEVFVVQHMDQILDLESKRYEDQRPIGFSNWPTLDPLYHYTEVENGLTDEIHAIDLEEVELRGGFEAGMFMSYHAYPYYPDFILWQPEYQEAADDEGPNSYLGYLEELRAYHQKWPILVAEIGHPSSQGTAHVTVSGLDHGGLDEVEQGHAVVRSLRSVASAGLDGAIVFALIDEWFKRTWIVDRVDFPLDARKAWHNVMSPEQNFGLIALRAGAPDDHHVLDGETSDWEPGDFVLEADGPLTALALDHDEAYLHVLVTAAPGALDLASRDLVLAFDTYDPSLGDRFVSPEKTVALGRRAEFVLRIVSPAEALHQVDPPYSLHGLWHKDLQPYQVLHSVANEDGVFELVRTKTQTDHSYQGKLLGKEHHEETGRLPTGLESARSTSCVFVDEAEGVVEVRVPWTLLAVVDPTTRRVVDHHGSPTAQLETVVTGGIAVAALLLGGGDALVASLPAAKDDGGLPEVPKASIPVYTWEGWDANTLTFHERRKASFDIVKAGLSGVLDEAGF